VAYLRSFQRLVRGERELISCLVLPTAAPVGVYVCAQSTNWYEAQVKQWAYLRSPDQANIPKVGATSDTCVTIVSRADEATS